MKRSFLVPVAVAIACGLFIAPGANSADLITNGDFEILWLDNWGASAPPASVQADPVIDGSASALFPVGNSGGIEQQFAETLSEWQLDFDIVSEDPGGVDDRSLSAAVQRFNDSDEDRPMISYRINGDGDLQVYDRGGYGWFTPSGLAGAVDFVGDVTSVSQSLLVNHVSIVGHFNQATPTYDISVTNSSSQVSQATGLSYWNDLAVAPVQGDGVEGLMYSTSSIAGSYLMDNITLEDGSAASPVGNGDFEAYLDGWVNASPSVQSNPAISGSASALFLTGYSGGIDQHFDETPPTWQVDFDIASEDPGDSGDRSLSAAIQRFNSSDDDRPLVSYRINGDGDLQVYDRGGFGWFTPSGLAGAISFVDDVTSTTEPLDVNHVTLVGHFDGSTPTYDIIVTNAEEQVSQATGLSYWNDLDVVPAQGEGLEGLYFSCSSIKGNYLLDNVALTDQPSGDLQGDLDGDGFVGSSDLDIVRSFWGQSVSVGDLLSGDPSGDGTVGSADLDIVRANWGRGAAASSAAVPEPATLAALAGALAVWILRRRR